MNPDPDIESREERDAEDHMRRALALAREALDRDEAPVGAVVVKDGVVLGEGFDLRQSLHDPAAHAEILALRAAAERLGTWNLSGAEMFVTLEPCPMCAGAILMARLSRVVWGADSPKWGAVVSNLQMFDAACFPHRTRYASGLLKQECAELLSRYFQKKRR
ncbi:MAG: tRNA adenosine(34) deaminase TadA [Candidatus Sumerlaeia bacterium]